MLVCAPPMLALKVVKARTRAHGGWAPERVDELRAAMAEIFGADMMASAAKRARPNASAHAHTSFQGAAVDAYLGTLIVQASARARANVLSDDLWMLWTRLPKPAQML